MKPLPYRIGYIIGEALAWLSLIGAIVLLALGSWLLLGCCPAIASDEPIHFDRTFTNEERLQLLSATAEWSVAMDTPLPPIDWEEPHGFRPSHWADERSVVHRMTEGEAATLRDIADLTDGRLYSENFVGLASTGGSIIIAIERLRIEDVSSVMRHELGHRYGCLGHTDPPSLMVGTLGKDLKCIDLDTITEVCDVNDCGPNWGTTCN